VSNAVGSTTVTGSGTSFTTDFAVGDSIIVGTATQTVVSITNNGQLITALPLNPNANTSAYSIQKVIARFNTSAGAFAAAVGAKGGLIQPCATGFTAINGGRLCVSSGALRGPGPFYGTGSAAAWTDCAGSFTSVGVVAHVCTYSEAMTACSAGFNFFPSQPGWFGDLVGDNIFMSWNQVGCTANGDNNGGGLGSGTSMPWRCCY
jgi:hypothetical protein